MNRQKAIVMERNEPVLIRATKIKKPAACTDNEEVATIDAYETDPYESAPTADIAEIYEVTSLKHKIKEHLSKVPILVQYKENPWLMSEWVTELKRLVKESE